MPAKNAAIAYVYHGFPLARERRYGELAHTFPGAVLCGVVPQQVEAWRAVYMTPVLLRLGSRACLGLARRSAHRALCGGESCLHPWRHGWRTGAAVLFLALAARLGGAAPGRIWLPAGPRRSLARGGGRTDAPLPPLTSTILSYRTRGNRRPVVTTWGIMLALIRFVARTRLRKAQASAV
jgi:hypothetical protein